MFIKPNSRMKYRAISDTRNDREEKKKTTTRNYGITNTRLDKILVIWKTEYKKPP